MSCFHNVVDILAGLKEAKDFAKLKPLRQSTPLFKEISLCIP